MYKSDPTCLLWRDGPDYDGMFVDQEPVECTQKLQELPSCGRRRSQNRQKGRRI
jgi:hypothetical protein